MLYPQNGDRIVAVDYVTSLRSVYCAIRLFKLLFRVNANVHQ